MGSVTRADSKKNHPSFHEAFPLMLTFLEIERLTQGPEYTWIIPKYALL